MNATTAIRKIGFMPTHAEMQNLLALCNLLGTCPYYAKMGPGGVLAIYLSALELGLPPMGSLNGGMHIIENKITISAQYMNLMVVQAGHRADVVYLSAKGCKIRFVRSDRTKDEGDTYEYEFKEEDAQRAGYFGLKDSSGQVLRKAKDNWVNNPRDMYYARCLSGGARKFMPDILMNVYVLGEIPGDEDIKIDTVENIPLPQKQEKTLITDQVDPTLIENFIQKHSLKDPNSRKSIYVEKVLSASIKAGYLRTLSDVISSAAKDEEKFLKAYEGWEVKQVSEQQVSTENGENQ